MSQPEPDLNTQKRRHAGPLIGIIAVLGFVALILAWFFGTEAIEGNAPVGAETQIDGRTGEEEDAGGGNAVAPPVATPQAETTAPSTTDEDTETTTTPTSPPDGVTPPAGGTSTSTP